MTGALLVAGTTSDAGKTVLTTGICRWLRRKGVRVAPFKAQNMSNNSMVTAEGAEIGRAQWIQAIAAGAEPEAAMNPVLLKPGSDLRSHVVVNGRPFGELDAAAFGSARPRLAEAAYAAYDDLRGRYDVVVCEGAGSPTEINLRAHDFVNMGLAQHGRIPTLVVGDIDRGGVFAAMYGTLKLMPAEDQDLVAGFVINKFRGDRALLQPGIEMIQRACDRPVLGVVPWLPRLWLDSEDALDVAARRATAPTEGQVLRVAVLRFPQISNFTDLDALAVEPNVEVVFTHRPAEVLAADLAVLPGSRATLADLRWLRRHRLDEALARRQASGRPVLGICGGYQMLGARIEDHDAIEDAAPGAEPGLGLLPVRTRFHAAKVLGRPAGTGWGEPVTGYEIHHGRVDAWGGEPFPGGCGVGATWGTLWHGLLECDGFRRLLLAEVAAAAGHDDWKPCPDTVFAASREDRLDVLADAVEEHLDTAAIDALLASR